MISGQHCGCSHHLVTQIRPGTRAVVLVVFFVARAFLSCAFMPLIGRSPSEILNALYRRARDDHSWTKSLSPRDGSNSSRQSHFSLEY